MVSARPRLERVDAIEAALAQLTAKTEALEFRINQIVADGTNRIGDLEFRLVELAGGDLGKLGPTPTLGGDTGAPAAAIVAPSTGDSSASLATNEQGDFDRAKAALDAGDFRAAADQFATFTQTYTGGCGAVQGRAGPWPVRPGPRCLCDAGGSRGAFSRHRGGDRCGGAGPGSGVPITDDAALLLQAQTAMQVYRPRRLAVAVSGGSDSLATLYLLWHLSRRQGWALHAVTIDHALRA